MSKPKVSKLITTPQAAIIVGVAVGTIRAAIRAKRLPYAERIQTPNGYYYKLKESDVIKYRDLPQGKGYPRGRKRS